MKQIAKLVSALASLAWPAVVFYVFRVLQDDIKKLMGRLRKGKLFGQEIELGDELSELERTVESVIDIVPNTTTAADQAVSSYRERILAESERSALGAFLRVSSDLELMVNQVLARTGWHGGRNKYSVQEGFARIPLDLTGRDLLRTVEQFSHLRNRIIHESRLVSEEEVRRAIEIALSLFEALKSYPIEENRVKDLVEIYPDVNGEFPPIDGILGLRLTTSQGDLPLQTRLFPTTKAWYQPGQLVSWDWNMGLVVRKAYYRDPEDATMKLAWNSSAEFVGRPLQELG